MACLSASASASATARPQGAAGAPDAAAVEPRALIERQLRLLGELAELGLNIARAVERQATGGATCEATSQATGAAQVVTGDVSLAYARVARAVRLTVALQSALMRDLQALDEVTERHLKGGRSNAAQRRKARVRRILDRVIEAEVADAAEGERLAGEARERLEHDDIYGDVLSKPVGEIVALVCRDLGLSPDWSRLAQEAWAQEEIAGGQAGSPFLPRRCGWLDPPEAEVAAAGWRLTEPQATSP